MKVQYSSPSGTSLANVVKNLCLAMYQKISFGYTADNMDQGQNIDGRWFTGTTPASANDAFTLTIAPPLNRIPLGFLVISIDAAATIYSYDIAGWTASTMQLKCSGASVNYRILVL